jgi:hypothetical protein
MVQVLTPESRGDWNAQSNDAHRQYRQDVLESLGRTVARCQAISMRTEPGDAERKRPLLTHCRLVTVLDPPA